MAEVEAKVQGIMADVDDERMVVMSTAGTSMDNHEWLPERWNIFSIQKLRTGH